MERISDTSGNQSELSRSKLQFTIALNLLITIAEIIGGFLSNSLSLLSDSVHNLSDTFSLLVAFIANKIGSRKSNRRKTFGYKRIEILAALFNSSILFAVCFFLFYEAALRMFNPEPIKGLIMFSVATIGLLANLISVLLLKTDQKKNLNIKAAYLHLLGDTLSSVVVILGGILIYFFGLFWLDPILTILIGIFILKEAFSVVAETVNILMQSAPGDINFEEIKNAILKFKEVKNIHHVHLWNLDDKTIHFECHIDLVQDYSISITDNLRMQIEKSLNENFGINHITLQTELNYCSNKDLIND